MLEPGAMLGAPRTLISWLEAARREPALRAVAERPLPTAVPAAFLFEGLRPVVQDVNWRARLASYLTDALRAAAPVGAGPLTRGRQMRLGAAPAFFGALWGLTPQPVSQLAAALRRTLGQPRRGLSDEEYVSRVLGGTPGWLGGSVAPADFWTWLRQTRPTLAGQLLSAPAGKLGSFQPPLGVVGAGRIFGDPERLEALVRAARSESYRDAARLGPMWASPSPLQSTFGQLLRRDPEMSLESALRELARRFGERRYAAWAEGRRPIPAWISTSWQQARRAQSPAPPTRAARPVVDPDTPETELMRKLGQAPGRDPSDVGRELLAMLRGSVVKLFPGRDELVTGALRQLQGLGAPKTVRNLAAGNRQAFEALLDAFRRGVRRYIPDPNQATDEALARLRAYLDTRTRALSREVRRRGRPPAGR